MRKERETYGDTVLAELVPTNGENPNREVITTNDAHAGVSIRTVHIAKVNQISVLGLQEVQFLLKPLCLFA